MLFLATEPALYFQPVWCWSAAAFLVLLFCFLTFKLLFHWLAARSCFPEPSPSLLPRKAFDSLLVQSRAHVLSLLTYICTVQHFRAGHAASLPPSFPWVPTECLGLGSSAGDGICGNNSQCHVQWCVQQGGVRLCPESHPALEGQSDMERTILLFIEMCSSHSVTEWLSNIYLFVLFDSIRGIEKWHLKLGKYGNNKWCFCKSVTSLFFPKAQMEVVASILASSLSLSSPPRMFPCIAMSIHSREKIFLPSGIV